MKKRKKMKTLDIVLLCVFGYMIYLNWQMLEVFREFGSAPETAWCALIAALIGECGICGWIKTNFGRSLETMKMQAVTVICTPRYSQPCAVWKSYPCTNRKG